MKGVSIIEILIALAVLMLSVGAVIMLVFANQNLKNDIITNNEGISKAQEVIEGLRAKSRQDFNLVATVAPTADGIYTKGAVVTDVDDYTKLINTTVSWAESASRAITVKFATIVTDPVSALGGDTCNPTLSGDWTNPQLLGTADFSSPEGGTDVDIFGKKAYVTTDPSALNKKDFYIIDVTDPTMSDLPILGKVHTGPGLAAVQIAGKYAYVADISTTAQLQVIDISNASDPVLMKSLDVTAGGDTAVGNSIFYSKKRIYLGLTKSTGKEFYVLDVSNPLDPIVKASFETNTKINDIVVRGGIAYLSVPDNPLSATPEQLRLLDVSSADTGAITEINTFSYPNASTMSGQGLYLSKDGNTLYFGRGGANSAHNPEFFSLNVANPTSITQNNSKFIDSTVNAVTVRTNLAFMVTSDPSLGFQIWNLDNLSNPAPYGSINVEQTSTGGMDCEGNYMFIAQRSNKAMQIIGPGP